MASAYNGFSVIETPASGVPISVGAGVEVHARALGEVADVAESPLETNADGEIDAGTFAGVDPGTVVFFRVNDYESPITGAVVSQVMSQTTTEIP